MNSAAGSGKRIDLAKAAALALLDTLTWKDYVTLIAFSGSITVYKETLSAATDAEKAALTTWIEGNIIAGGSTNFALSVRRNRSQKSTTSRNGFFLARRKPFSPRGL